MKRIFLIFMLFMGTFIYCEYNKILLNDDNDNPIIVITDENGEVNLNKNLIAYIKIDTNYNYYEEKKVLVLEVKNKDNSSFDTLIIKNKDNSYKIKVDKASKFNVREENTLKIEIDDIDLAIDIIEKILLSPTVELEFYEDTILKNVILTNEEKEGALRVIKEFKNLSIEEIMNFYKMII